MKHRAHGSSGSTPESATQAQPAPAGEGLRRDTWAVLVLGLNAWGVALVWPLLAGEEGEPQPPWWPLAGSLAPLLLAGALEAPLARRTGLLRTVPAALLLAAFPAALGFAFASRPEPLNQRAFGPLALVLLWASLCAYGTAALALCRETAPQLTARHAALGEEPWDAQVRERSPLQRLVIALCAAGAAAIALIAPSLGGYAGLTTAWGDTGAIAGGLLTAVVGAALGVAVVAVFLGSALRADAGTTPRSSAADATLRTAWFLFLALLSFVTYFVVQP
jgi:MFS family permease